MISVSNGFKQAIKSEDREIHGYVEVVYQTNDYDLDVEQIPQLASIVLDNGSGLLSNKKIMNKYVALEENYTLLDGSFMLWNSNIVDDTGIITKNIFESINDTTISISNSSSSTPVKGITVYFRENIPFDFDITYTFSDESTETNNVRNNTNKVYQYVFDSEKNITEMTIEILNVEFPKHRLKIASVDFNLSDLYEDNELISFDVNEEMDLFFESLPINTCTININNYPDKNGGSKFDPLNPKGIVKYLNDDVTIKPYIGVLTEENGVEYVNMGEFFLTDWQSNDNANVKLNGSNCMYKIKNMDIVKESHGFLSTRFTKEQTNEYLSNLTGFTIYLLTGPTLYNAHLRDFNLGNWLLARLPFYSGFVSGNSYIYNKIVATRNNSLEMSRLINTPVDTMLRTFLKKDAVFENRNVITNVQITDISSSTAGAYIATRNAIDDEHVMTSNTEYVWYPLEHYTDFQGTSFTYTSTQGGNAVMIDRSNYLVLVKYSGTIGETIHVVYNGNMFEDYQTKTTTWNTNKIGDSIKIDFTRYFNAVDNDLNNTAKFYLTMNKSYKVSASTMGDPSIEVGDSINIQTRYQNTNDGFKNIIVTKQQFTYDGGLQCELEGLSD